MKKMVSVVCALLALTLLTSCTKKNAKTEKGEFTIEKGKLSIMALTDGPTLQDTRKIEFKRIMRPMFPIDEI